MPKAPEVTKLLEDVLANPKTEEYLKTVGEIIHKIKNNWTLLFKTVLDGAPANLDPEDKIKEFKDQARNKIYDFAKKIHEDPKNDLFWIAFAYMCDDENFHLYDEVEEGKFKGLYWDEAMSRLTGQAARLFTHFKSPGDFK